MTARKQSKQPAKRSAKRAAPSARHAKQAPQDTELRTGAQCVVDSLVENGAEVVFGYPGGMILDVFNLIGAAPIHFILPRHEQGAVHAADGYARASGKVGVCLVTSGPGATNTITGLATANMDGIPLVCICGQVPLTMIDGAGHLLPLTHGPWLADRIAAAVKGDWSP